MRYKPKTRVCAYTHVYEKDLPPGQKLLNCSKCHETCYIDKASQIAHWKQGHKHVCCDISKDAKGVGAETDAQREGTNIEDFDSAMETAGFLLSNPQRIKGRSFGTNVEANTVSPSTVATSTSLRSILSPTFKVP